MPQPAKGMWDGNPCADLAQDSLACSVEHGKLAPKKCTEEYKKMKACMAIWREEERRKRS